MVTARYLVITTRYLVVTDGYSSLLVVTARLRSLLLVPTFSMNVYVLSYAHLRYMKCLFTNIQKQ